MERELLFHEIENVNGSRLISKAEIEKLSGLTPGGGGSGSPEVKAEVTEAIAKGDLLRMNTEGKVSKLVHKIPGASYEPAKLSRVLPLDIGYSQQLVEPLGLNRYAYTYAHESKIKLRILEITGPDTYRLGEPVVVKSNLVNNPECMAYDPNQGILLMYCDEGSKFTCMKVEGINVTIESVQGYTGVGYCASLCYNPDTLRFYGLFATTGYTMYIDCKDPKSMSMTNYSTLKTPVTDYYSSIYPAGPDYNILCTKKGIYITYISNGAIAASLPFGDLAWCRATVTKDSDGVYTCHGVYLYSTTLFCARYIIDTNTLKITPSGSKDLDSLYIGIDVNKIGNITSPSRDVVAFQWRKDGDISKSYLGSLKFPSDGSIQLASGLTVLPYNDVTFDHGTTLVVDNGKFLSLGSSNKVQWGAFKEAEVIYRSETIGIAKESQPTVGGQVSVGYDGTIVSGLNLQVGKRYYIAGNGTLTLDPNNFPIGTAITSDNFVVDTGEIYREEIKEYTPGSTLHSPSSKIQVTVSDDGWVKFWDGMSCYMKTRLNGVSTDMLVLKDGKYIPVGSGSGGGNTFSKILMTGDNPSIVNNHPMFGELPLVSMEELTEVIGNPLGDLSFRSSSAPKFNRFEQKHTWEISKNTTTPIPGSSWTKTLDIYPDYKMDTDYLAVMGMVVSGTTEIELVLTEVNSSGSQEIYRQVHKVAKRYESKPISLAFVTLKKLLRLDDYSKIKVDVKLVDGKPNTLCGEGFPVMQGYMLRESSQTLATAEDIKYKTVSKTDERAFEVQGDKIVSIDSSKYRVYDNRTIQVPERSTDGTIIREIGDSVFNYLSTQKVFIPATITKIGINNLDKDHYSVVTPRGSYAETWCKTNGVTYESDGKITNEEFESKVDKASSDYVIESSRTSESWFRKWKSGYVEQGGWVGSPKSEQQVIFPVEMASSDWFPTVTPHAKQATDHGRTSLYVCKETTKSGFPVNPLRNMYVLVASGASTDISGYWWKIEGMYKV